jgi:hypothetical protein
VNNSSKSFVDRVLEILPYLHIGEETTVLTVIHEAIQQSGTVPENVSSN